MSSSITIPKRKNPQSNPVQAPSSSSSSYTPPFSRTPRTMSSPSTPVDAKSSRPMYDRRPSLLSSSLSKQEHTVVNVGHPDGPPRLVRTLRPPSPTCYSLEHQLISNVTDNLRQGLARLRLESGHVFPNFLDCLNAAVSLTTIRRSDIFLPSYADRDSSELERRKDPVHDIVLTDEEANNVFPS